MLVVDLFKITRTRKLFRCLLIVVYQYLVKSLSNRRNNADIHKTWMDIKGSMLTERS